ncbi:hypothetical protein [Sandaracinus amylolyticus]|uniref:hypothetical protein n=1 Tax=Sandaracinus amylolyticus TaxID=927083 RepID=UPI001F29CF2E|nr:hypothetical protein [Sandaracinus amylolyticus]UJR78404.1 Tryptophan synthase alpha chain [Sandaracinus amylolyticus]
MRARAILLLALVVGCTSDPVDEVDAGGDDAGGLDASQDVDGGDPRARCDEEGEVCCADGQCGNGLPCMAGLCGYQGCGEIGLPCCAEGYCHLGIDAVCEDGMCVEPGCGSEGHECCFEGTPCREDFLCHEGTCLRCGALGEQCCPGAECDGDLYCLAESGTLGQCLSEPPPCGGEYERCCDEGAACGAGLGCTSMTPGDSFSQCLPGPTCGADGRTCCEGETRCGAGMSCTSESDGVDRCRRCGDFELPCCEGARACGPGLTCAGDICGLP